MNTELTEENVGVGMVVRLKSDGRPMTIILFLWPQINCAWFDQFNEYHRETFLAQDLEVLS